MYLESVKLNEDLALGVLSAFKFFKTKVVLEILQGSIEVWNLDLKHHCIGLEWVCLLLAKILTQ